MIVVQSQQIQHDGWNATAQSYAQWAAQKSSEAYSTVTDEAFKDKVIRKVFNYKADDDFLGSFETSVNVGLVLAAARWYR